MGGDNHYGRRGRCDSNLNRPRLPFLGGKIPHPLIAWPRPNASDATLRRACSRPLSENPSSAAGDQEASQCTIREGRPSAPSLRECEWVYRKPVRLVQEQLRRIPCLPSVDSIEIILAQPIAQAKMNR